MSDARTDIIKDLRKHKAHLTQEFGVTDLAVFGSVARNTALQDCDLDVPIKANHDFIEYNGQTAGHVVDVLPEVMP